MKNYYIAFLLFMSSCQCLPQLAEVATEAVVEEIVELEVHKEHGAFNVSLDVKKEPKEEEQNRSICP